jgi:hypothetical protein
MVTCPTIPLSVEGETGTEEQAVINNRRIEKRDLAGIGTPFLY